MGAAHLGQHWLAAPCMPSRASQRQQKEVLLAVVAPCLERGLLPWKPARR